MKACVACGGAEFRRALEIADYPAYLVPLPRPLAREVVRATLRVDACERCGHLQQLDPDEALRRLIYERYYAHYVVDEAEAFAPHYRRPFEECVRSLEDRQQLPRGELLEVGCSSGQAFPFWSELGERYTGIDPSPRVEAARTRFPGGTFLRGYFPLDVDGRAFDVVVTQFNLEHAVDAGVFLAACHRHTRPEGLLLVQVPDVGAFVRTAQPNPFAHEHVHYFTRPTLERALLRAGFAPFAWGPEGPSLIVAARRVTPVPEPPARESDPGSTAAALSALFAKRPPLPVGPSALYGVGPLTHWLLQGSHTPEVAVVDDNPAYEGCGLPGHALTVHRPSAALFRERPHVVLSLNALYHQRVLDRIRAMGVPVRAYTLRDGRWDVQEVR